VFIPEVFKPAILANASSVILVHNHPSGDTNPSETDILITKRLRDAGEILGIEVVDHVIIGKGGHTSLKTIGLLGEK
jgi:DNA repair protein RadC